MVGHNSHQAFKWDGTQRLDTWLIDYFGATNNDYIKAVGSKTLIAAVARVYIPGGKADTVTILDGAQGLFKSTAWRILAGDEWFTDHMPDLHSKDAMEQLAGKWIIELAELSALNRSDLYLVKRFLSSVQDDFRPAYGRHKVTYPRQCTFVGTTNDACYLKDPTGGRRFWPVTVTKKCDIAKLKEERNQLWAEAVARFKAGEKWYLSDELEIKAAEEQTDRIEPDEWSTPIMEYLQACPRITFITTGNILEDVLGIEKKDWVIMVQKRVASILRSHGWKQSKGRVEGVQTKGFLRPTPPPNDPETPPTQPAPEGATTGKPSTDGTHKEGKGTTKKPSKINAGTAGTDGTDTLLRGGVQGSHENKAKATVATVATTKIMQNTPWSSLKNIGTKGTIGTTSQAVDSIGVFGASPGTDTRTPSGTGTTLEIPGNTGNTDNIVDSVEVSDFAEAGTGTTLASEDPPDHGPTDPNYFASMPEFGPCAAPAKEPPVAAVASPKHCNNCLHLDPSKAGCRFRFGVIPLEQRATPPCNGADFEPKEVRS